MSLTLYGVQKNGEVGELIVLQNSVFWLIFHFHVIWNVFYYDGVLLMIMVVVS